jgi:tRNA nucleotidyltransferase (CCA-adding enzyme)
MKQVLAKIQPSPQERKQVKTITTTFLTALNKHLKYAKALVGGSAAKGTWLSGGHDIDIYALFEYKKFKGKSGELSELLVKSLRKAFPQQKIERLHGSRDYFQIHYEHYVFEVVPIIKISKAEDALNITDISPLHAQWVNKQGKAIKPEIMLAKQFCKANRCYGAESFIAGFSGYVLEILIAYYGSLKKLLQASLKWKKKEVIDPSTFFPKRDALFHMNKSKQQSPIIVIDPVDKSRNAAAALNLEQMKVFQSLARKYLKKPSGTYFEKEEFSLEKLQKQSKSNHLVYLEVAPLPGKHDVVGAKLLKVFTHLKRELMRYIIVKADWEWEKLYFIVKEKKLPAMEIRQGPPIKLKEFVKDFKKKNKNAFVKNGKIAAKVEVMHPKLEDFVKHALKHPYVQERIKKVKKIVIL